VFGLKIIYQHVVLSFGRNIYAKSSRSVWVNSTCGQWNVWGRLQGKSLSGQTEIRPSNEL